MLYPQNADYTTQQISDLSQKLERAEFQVRLHTILLINMCYILYPSDATDNGFLSVFRVVLVGLEKEAALLGRKTSLVKCHKTGKQASFKKIVLSVPH